MILPIVHVIHVFCHRQISLSTIQNNNFLKNITTSNILSTPIKIQLLNYFFYKCETSSVSLHSFATHSSKTVLYNGDCVAKIVVAASDRFWRKPEQFQLEMFGQFGKSWERQRCLPIVFWHGKHCLSSTKFQPYTTSEKFCVLKNGLWSFYIVPAKIPRHLQKPMIQTLGKIKTGLEN